MAPLDLSVHLPGSKTDTCAELPFGIQLRQPPPAPRPPGQPTSLYLLSPWPGSFVVLHSSTQAALHRPWLLFCRFFGQPCTVSHWHRARHTMSTQEVVLFERANEREALSLDVQYGSCRSCLFPDGTAEALLQSRSHSVSGFLGDCHQVWGLRSFGALRYFPGSHGAQGRQGCHLEDTGH